MPPRPAPAFWIVLVATLALVALLDVVLAHARSTGVLPHKSPGDCTSPAPAATPSPTAGAAAAGASTPAPFAAFAACGDGTGSAKPDVK